MLGHPRIVLERIVFRIYVWLLKQSNRTRNSYQMGWRLFALVDFDFHLGHSSPVIVLNLLNNNNDKNGYKVDEKGLKIPCEMMDDGLTRTTHVRSWQAHPSAGKKRTFHVATRWLSRGSPFSSSEIPVLISVLDGWDIHYRQPLVAMLYTRVFRDLKVPC